MLFGAKVKARSEALTRALKEAEDKASRKPGVRDWPPWLVEFSKPRHTQARNARILDKQTKRAARDPELDNEFEALKKKVRSERQTRTSANAPLALSPAANTAVAFSSLSLSQAQSHLLPPLVYENWAGHVPMPPDMRHWSVKPNLREPGDYFRIDSIGWTKEDGYIYALRSPEVDQQLESLYDCLSNFFVVASKEGDKKPDPGEKVKILELGSGSGQHAVAVCERNKDTVQWQPTDISDVCIDSVNRRSKFYGVQKNQTPQGMNGNMNKAFKFDILYYDRMMGQEGPLDNKWRR